MTKLHDFLKLVLTLRTVSLSLNTGKVKSILTNTGKSSLF